MTLMIAQPLVPSALSRRKGSGPARREQILDAAQILFLEAGFDGASMRRIAQSVGLSATALYGYFRDKYELFAEISDRAADQLIAAFVSCQAARPLDRLRAIGRLYIAFGRDHPDAYRLIFMTPPPSGATQHAPSHRVINDPEHKGQRGALCFGHIVAEVERAIAVGDLRKADPALIAEAMWASLHGYVALTITHGGGFPEPTALESLMIDAMITAFRA